MSDQRLILFTDNAKFSSVPATDGKLMTLVGYAVLWNTLSEDRGGFKIRLKPGSAKVLTPSHALFQHDYRLVIGSTENGTLRYSLDDYGVRVEIDLPNTSTGRDTFELVGKGYVRGMSFGMLKNNPKPMGTLVYEDDQEIVEIESFAMDEVTITAKPAFGQTFISVKEIIGDPQFSVRQSQALRLEQLDLEMLRL